MNQSFLSFCSLALIAIPGSCAGGEVREVQTDLLVVGGTESGWAAAIQAARMGVPSVTIVHDGQWLGGQFTEQALACVDENKGIGDIGWGVDWHPMKRSFHRSGLFKELMDRIEAFNAQKYGSPMPGRPYHGPSTFRPAEAEKIFRELLQPYLDKGQVRLITNRYPVRADVERHGGQPRLSGLWFAPVSNDEPDVHVTARLTIDASDWGEAIQVSGAAFECGPDPKSRYNEPSAPADLSQNPPNEMNPITWAMIVEQSDADTPIPQPPQYDDRYFVRSSQISLAAMRDLRWDRPAHLGSIPHWPDAGKASPRQLSVYTVRRLVDGYTSKTGRTIILLNYTLGQDYPLERLPQVVVAALEAAEPGASSKNIVTMTRRQRQIIFDDAKRHSLCLLYHLQNFVHERAADRTNSFRHFQLSDEFGTADRLPPKPYIRESLRLKAMYMMREHDGRNNDGETKAEARERFARIMYFDGVLAWQFHYDFHNTGRAYLHDEGDRGPWIDYEKPGRHTHHVSDRSVFPLRSLIPEEMDGLLGAQKNLGYSSIVCAAIRLHDQGIAIGQASGAAAAVSLRHNIQPRAIAYDRSRLEEVRGGLCGELPAATPLLIWPFRDLSADHQAFVAINRLAAGGALPLDEREVDFRPDDAAEPPWREEVVRRTLAAKRDFDTLTPPAGQMTRGEFCRLWWELAGELPDRPFDRLTENDADQDGILDGDDPTLFTPDKPIVWSIAAPPLNQDGLIEPIAAQEASQRLFNFTGQGSPPVSGFTNDVGLVFDERRGFGWSRDIGANNRRRGVLPESYRDTFLFTRDYDCWQCAVPNGKWVVTVCVGDAAYEQVGQRVTIEGIVAVDNVTTPRSRFLEKTVTVEVTDGRLTVELGTQNSSTNTCLNWLRLSKE
jgi:hypothetical protein